MQTGLKHNPNRFDSYQEIHNTVINKFRARGDFIGSETLCFDPLAYGILLSGEIGCLGEIVVCVEKFLEVVSGFGANALVQTKEYSYNVFIRGHYNLFRYDNQDGEYLRPGHHDPHHKHLFDWQTGGELVGSPQWVGEASWLTLGEVLQEAEAWYWQHREQLPHPDAYPQLDLRD